MRPTKNADTLRTWLQKPKDQRVCDLVLYFESTILETWPRESAESSSGAENILAAAQMHCDTLDKTCMYTAQWRDADRLPLGSKLLTCQPDEDMESLAGASLSQGLGLSYKAQATSMALVKSMVEPIIVGFQKVIDSQSRQIDKMQIEIESLRLRLHGAALPSEPLPENEEVTRLKVKALTNLSELGPDVGRLALAAIAKVLKLEADAGGSENTVQ